MNPEKQRLINDKGGKQNWRLWGPYLTDRQWGTVREDYSSNGEPWNYITREMAGSKAYRWGEEGIGGLSDEKQLLCFSLALWNYKDPFLKERFFGLSGKEGNHGEDVKEYYYYLDNLPTHAYMKMLYKYPQSEFPYSTLIDENKKRTKLDPEFELIDTGIFNEDKYFDVFIEYAKAGIADLLIKITAFNRSADDAELNLIPQIWFRNTWDWGYDDYKPQISFNSKKVIEAVHEKLGKYFLYSEKDTEIIFCENETNIKKLYDADSDKKYFKDGVNDYIVSGNKEAVNSKKIGTKAGLNFKLSIPAGKSKTIRLRLKEGSMKNPFNEFEKIFKSRVKDADEFYADIQSEIKSADEKNVQRQAYAGMLWSKQFYYYNIAQWLSGDPAQPPPPPQRINGRNSEWFHLNNADIISMPDKWEYPWYASWDLAFHCIPLSVIDPEFAKKQLKLLTKEWYMHPNGELPAYEWSFSEVNPPVHAWATWRVYKIDEKINGKGDTSFLEEVFHKLLLNFTWWVNITDTEDRNLFEGGFLGLDNIGVFDRNAELPTGGFIEQADCTSWVAMYCLNLLRISLELSIKNKVYQSTATKFFEHFLYIAAAMVNIGGKGDSLWDDNDEFYYDTLHTPDDNHIRLKVRSVVGLLPLCAVEVLEPELVDQLPEFSKHADWFLNHYPDLASLVSRWNEGGVKERRLLSLLRGHRMKRLLYRMLDESEFLSDYGVRSLSKYHKDNPYVYNSNGTNFTVAYLPSESDSYMFGGNSNWRGPVWFPINYLIIESLQKFHHYYGDDFKVEYPTHSGNFLTIKEISIELAKRLSKLFLKDENGKRTVYGNNEKFQNDPHFKDYILFYEYFNGDNGKGLGASHQTGWTGLIAKLLQPRRDESKSKKNKSSKKKIKKQK